MFDLILNIQESETNLRNARTLAPIYTFSSMNPINLDTLDIQIMVEKLNDKNYREMFQSIKLVINGKGKIGYLIG